MAISLFVIIFLVGFVTVLYVTSPVKFDKSKITDSKLKVSIYDNCNIELQGTNLANEFVPLSQIPKHTIDCFISIEDKQFYSHSGINYKRIAVAVLKNIVSMKFKEGASTISQQLIKNTHLTREKTLARKINEIKLTKNLENNMTKDEILEYYLNIIYFGDNCYGIQSASKHYFSHPACKLTLNESAMLSGIIKSPNKYHPVKNFQNCIARKNLVLGELYKDGKISQNTLTELKQEDIKINIDDNQYGYNGYIKACIKEAEDILKIPEKSIAIGGFKIFTYHDRQKQECLEQSIGIINDDCQMISMTSKDARIEAYAEKSSIPLFNIKRQPASAIKPTLVYAPAINENIISPKTVILDEEISINGYSPKNVSGNFHGYVSCEDALSMSLNIPAVKILSYVGINKAKSYLARQNVTFDKNDNNLALALGGFTNGMTLKELTNTYQTLANSGKFISAKFIDYISDKNGKIIYKNEQTPKTIYRDDTAFLTTNMLCLCAKKGTAKRLSDLKFDVASKTGTSSYGDKNLDAYNISYTTSDVVGCWVGNVDNKEVDTVGGSSPTLFVKNYLEKIYKQNKPRNFDVPSSVEYVGIDTLALQDDHTVALASDYLPERFVQKAYFSRFNLPPKKQFSYITPPPLKIEGMASNGVATITFDAEECYIYEFHKAQNGNDETILQLGSKKGKVKQTLPILRNEKTSIYVVVKLKNYKTGEVIYATKSNTITLYCK